ncbi:MAG: guanylate kinase [Myxococcales bacterium]|nr:guanylate kinase [Myxococcales bacterium]
MDDLLLLIVCSPSGAGKTTLTRKLLEAFPRLTFSVSHTTRQPRTGEVPGQDYHFINEAEFMSMVNGGHFAEWAKVHDNYYGTSLDELERARVDGKRGIVFDVDYQGARQIKASLPDAVGVFILPPSLEDLKTRLRTRGLDTEETIQKRFAKAKLEIEHYLFFDYLIINDQVEEAAARLRGIVYAENCRRARLAKQAEDLLRTGRINTTNRGPA